MSAASWTWRATIPRESRLFANEILQGAPRMREAIEGDLRRW